MCRLVLCAWVFQLLKIHFLLKSILALSCSEATACIYLSLPETLALSALFECLLVMVITTAAAPVTLCLWQV